MAEISPSNVRSSAAPYGTSTPAAPSAGLMEKLMGRESPIKIGVVTDVWTATSSCTVVCPGHSVGVGMVCLWGAAAINRFGGAADFNPPEVGSVVTFYEFPNVGHGVILGQVASPWPASTLEVALQVDGLSDVSALIEDTGSDPDPLDCASLSIAGSESQPMDIFPGDRGWINEFNLAIALFRFRALIKASDLAKMEFFLQDNLVRLTAHNMDIFTAGMEEIMRETPMGELLHSKFTTPFPAASRGTEEQPAVWARKSFLGVEGDLVREYAVSPPAEKDGAEIGLHQKFLDGTGFGIERSISGGGFVKSRAIGVPNKVGSIGDPGGSLEFEDPPADNFADFGWSSDIDLAAQVRDGLAWIMNRQGNARLYKKEEAVEPSDDASAAMFPGSGPSAGVGEYHRTVSEPLTIEDTPIAGPSKERSVQMGDAWILALPDGSVSIRDIWGSAITMDRGNITISASKDINYIAGRNIVQKAGRDIIVGARRSLDLTAGVGQARLWSRRGTMVHCEEAGVMISTHSTDIVGNPEAEGEKFLPSGIVLKTKGTLTVSAESEKHQINTKFHVKGRNDDSPPNVVVEANAAVIKGNSGVVLAAGKNSDGLVSVFPNVVKVNQQMDLLSNLFAHNGSVQARSVDSQGDKLGKIKPPRVDGRKGFEKIKKDIKPILEAASIYDTEALKKIEFQFRTKDDYEEGMEKFYFSEQPWQREWPSATNWGMEAKSVGGNSGKATWPFPGRKYWEGREGYKSYKEVNVGSDGYPLSGEAMAPEPGQVSDASLTNMKRHP